MHDLGKMLLRWGPAVLWMGVLFTASATPARDLPQFGALDYLVKKSGHMLGYSVLGLAFRWALDWSKRRFAAAWLLSIAYAILDELHQSFVAGRHPSPVDVFVFDGIGAAVALWLCSLWRRRAGTPAQMHSD